MREASRNISFRKVAIIALSVIALAVVAVIAIGRRSVTLTMINTAPYTIAGAVSNPVSREQWETNGWIEMAPGEIRKVEKVVWWIEPEFFVAARPLDPEILALFPPNRGWGWTGDDLQRVVIDGPMQFQTDARGQGVFPDGAYWIGFSRAARIERGEYAITFSDPYLPHLAPGGKDSLSLEAALLEARALARSLKTRVAFLREWSPEMFPYHLGIVTEDPNDFWRRGIVITSAASRTRDNHPMRLYAGDILMNFSGHPVYSKIDVLAGLYEHATDLRRGVEVPIAFVVDRDGQAVQDITTYFFNKAFWGSSDRDKFAAAFRGFENAVFLGAGCTGNTLLIKGAAALANALSWLSSKLDDKDDEPDYVETEPSENLRWACAQHDARMRQFEPDAYAFGNIGGALVGSSRLALKAVPGKTAKALSRSAGGAFALEIAESTVWTVVDGSPMRTSEELHEELGDVLPLAAASGLLQGSLRYR